MRVTEVAVRELNTALPGQFPVHRSLHGEAAFGSAVEARYPPGEGPGVGATTLWLRVPRLLANEEPSPFQRICALADSGNAISRNAEASEIRFVNCDVAISLHRDPEGEWLGSEAVSHWQPNGIGIADALLFDEQGVVGRAVQTLLLQPA